MIMRLFASIFLTTLAFGSRRRRFRPLPLRRVRQRCSIQIPIRNLRASMPRVDIGTLRQSGDAREAELTWPLPPGTLRTQGPPTLMSTFLRAARPSIANESYAGLTMPLATGAETRIIERVG
jgi:hypothetical protein